MDPMQSQPDFESIKTMTVVALFSDDWLMERLVFKGGNAMNLVYGMYNRASLDFDFSIEQDFAADEIEGIGARIRNALAAVFREKELVVFDYEFEPRPAGRNPGETGFWGGYVASFKLAMLEDYKKHQGNIAALRKKAVRIDKGGRQNIIIEISKYEYCEKEEKELDDYIIYVYPPVLLAIEKLRAICQQTDDFSRIVNKPGLKGRARDFFDIYYLCKTFDIDLASDDNLARLRNVFAAKRVPLETLGQIGNYRDIHEATFPAVVDTVSGRMQTHPFDFYYKFIIAVATLLKERLGVI